MTMGRFRMDESYIPRVRKMLEAGLSNAEIADNLQYRASTISSFIRKHHLLTECPTRWARGVMPQKNIRCYD